MDDRIKDLWDEYETRIAAAKVADNRDRHRFFCDDLEDTIGDFPAAILTLERYLLLSLDGIFDDADEDPRIPILRFLWIVSPDFSRDPADATAFIRANMSIDPTPFPTLIAKYIEDAFAYAPGRRRATNGKAKESTGREWYSGIIDTIASEYGWAERDIMRLPLPRLFLYVRQIRLRLGLDSAEFSSEADRLQDEFMTRANERN